MSRVEVGEYELVDEAGVWFLEMDGRIQATLIDMGGGTWRVRSPEGSVETVTVPPGTAHPARYVAEQVT
ncbi:hypothetical protein BKA00_005827 [Actinomadura coerulea]|uniref:Uncharacterized protein n=1 Tax=Actinomadura coerulea TaxID=46159 RepID=A0A7X0L1T0_9ACTN|nr:hypothetical protein [Actinomadura coerulea]MBB6398913.1 hypothetical protein [Actinomadura coerulea]GGP98299.1 hypothetical protein GCM10010187_12390 [Actinomadura coerulea]